MVLLTTGITGTTTMQMGRTTDVTFTAEGIIIRHTDLFIDRITDLTDHTRSMRHTRYTAHMFTHRPLYTRTITDPEAT
jgi:hypothetical protein